MQGIKSLKSPWTLFADIIGQIISIFPFLMYSDMAVSCSNINSTDIPERILNLQHFSTYFNGTTKYWLCFGMTVVAIVILIIEFDALINCYLKDVRNKYFIDAFEESVNERKNRE